MSRREQVKNALSQLRQSIQRPQKPEAKSPSQDSVSFNPDPCHLFVDAVDSTLAQIDTHQAALEDLALLWVDQMDALEACRLENPE